MSMEAFERIYRSGSPPWDMGGPSPFVERLVDSGELRDDILDAGCGTGDNAIFLAEQGHNVVGIDFAPTAIARAKRKAKKAGLKVEFLEADARELEGFDGRFNTVIDSGLFHSFSKEDDRARYVAALAGACRKGALVHMLCFSNTHHVSGDVLSGCGTHAVTKTELKKAFGKPWSFQRLENVEEWPEHFVWIASIRR
jgi:ubiquinone/menaquinone biosynthesis C-methylase UbiE